MIISRLSFLSTGACCGDLCKNNPPGKRGEAFVPCGEVWFVGQCDVWGLFFYCLHGVNAVFTGPGSVWLYRVICADHNACNQCRGYHYRYHQVVFFFMYLHNDFVVSKNSNVNMHTTAARCKFRATQKRHNQL